MKGSLHAMKAGALAAAALLAAILLLPRASGTEPAGPETGSSEPASSESANSESSGAGEKAGRVISIVAERFTFVPSRIKLKQGEVVELRIRSLDTNHGFHIRDAGVNVIVPKRGKGDARILFRAQEKGVFPFDCSKACGAGHTMMTGRIVVE
ncbi:MAG: cupredoxin domain-containing protein [Bryobacterales bacterium]